MITVEEAINLVRQHCIEMDSEPVPLAELPGRICASDVTSDECSPPFTKSLVDGFAVRSAEFDGSPRTLPIRNVIVAGQHSQATLPPDAAVQIMTGAAIPEGADCVVMIEETTQQSSAGQQQVTIDATHVKAGRNVLPRASVVDIGATLLGAGEMITGPMVGALAEFGKANGNVVHQPTLSVLTTGNEIVDHASSIRDAQIRNSNGPMLGAMAKSQGCVVTDLGIAGDDRELIKSKILSALASDIVVISGGVSVGILDLVPEVLSSLGVRQVFHKVALKPGKPVWFGIHENGNQRCLVFGLPGNPVSALVCFLLFVAEAIQQMTKSTLQRYSHGVLAKDFPVRGDRPTFWPCRIERSEQAQIVVHPLTWKGSSDLLTASKADAFAYFAEAGTTYQKDRVVKILWAAIAGHCS
jgi:molybdopterin molybdotransferase